MKPGRSKAMTEDEITARAEKAEARMAELEAERDLLALVQRATEANGGQP